jgi:PKD repeat protein
LSGNSTTPGATFNWTGPNGFNADIRNPEVSEPGVYTFTVTGPNGCSSSGDLNLIRDETTAPTAGFDVTITDDLGVFLTSTATGDPFSHFYDFGNGQTSTELNPSITYQSPGFKTITQIVSNQCGADTLEVIIELLPPAGAVSFCFPEKSEGAIGDTLNIPIKVTNFNEVASIQLSIHTGDPAVAQILGVGDFALPQLDEDDFNQTNDTTISMAWFFGNAATVADSTVIFTVQVLLTGTDAVCTPIFIDDTPVFVEVGVLDQNVNSIVSAPYEIVAGEVCILPIANIFGRVFRETGNGLKEVIVDCTDQLSVTTGPDGLFEFLELQTGLNYLVNPSRNTNPLEGVTAIDLALIQRHILTLQFLDSPYKIIAADVDLSNSVGAIDLANIQRLILGKTDAFPNMAESWRFADANYQFNDANNPLAEAFPEDRLIVDLRTDVTDVDFVGMKLGDVNGSALGRPLSTPLEVLLVEKTDGDLRTIEFRANRSQALSAYQFDVNFDPSQMQLMEISPGSLPGMNTGLFATHKIGEGTIPTLWYDPSGNLEGYLVEEGQVLFSLQFKTGAEVAPLQERVWTGARTMPAVAYNAVGREMPIHNVYQTTLGVAPEAVRQYVQMEPLRPNPFVDQTQIRFYLPQAAPVDIQIRDALGRTVKRIQQQFDAGAHRLNIQGSELGNSGWYVVQMRTGDFVESQRIVLQR